MSKIIKLFYVSSEIPSKPFAMMINPTITCEELLQIISNKQKKTHISIFLGKNNLKVTIISKISGKKTQTHFFMQKR